MSRSYKNVANVNDGAPHNFYKRYANQRVRAQERLMLREYELGDVERAEALELDDGAQYRLVVNGWNIRDYSFSYFNPRMPTGWFANAYQDTNVAKEWEEQFAKMKRK